MSGLANLRDEVEAALRQHQPELSAALLSDRIEVSGTFVCPSEQGPFDRFEIELAISPLFPQKEPSLKEVGGRIPRTVKRHVFPIERKLLPRPVGGMVAKR